MIKFTIISHEDDHVEVSGEVSGGNPSAFINGLQAHVSAIAGHFHCTETKILAALTMLNAEIAAHPDSVKSTHIETVIPQKKEK